MSDGNGVPTAENAKNGTDGASMFSLDELNRCKGDMLGGGEFGDVYAIKDFPGLAVKEIYLSDQPDRLKEITEFELEALSRFSHPGVLKYHQVLTNGDFVYIIMDRYHEDLKEFITDHARNHKSIPKELLLSILRQLADALAYVHAPYKVNEEGDVLPGIVHRDLKPANVLMSKDGERVAIADFGLCKDGLYDGRTIAGTPAYMAPEVFIYQKISRASDIWALGVIIYELATLELPSFSRKWEPEDAKKYFIPEWKPDLDAVKDEFTRTILEKIFVLDPEERPTAKELADRLRTLSAPASKVENQHKNIEQRIHHSALMATTPSPTSSALTECPEAPSVPAVVHGGDAEAVENDKGNSDNDAALMISAKVKHGDIVKLPDPIGDKSITALMEAAARNDVEAVKALISEQKNLRDNNGKTALMHAAERGSIDVLDVLLEYEKGMKDNQNHNALYHALQNGHTTVAKAIVPHEDPTDESGVTAFMRAAARGDAEMVELLAPLQKGLKDKDGDTAFNYALKNKCTDTAIALQTHEAPSWTPLMCAAFTGDIELARSHLSDKNKKNSDGDTALMIAARAGHKNIVELLDPTDWVGVTALMRAAIRGDAEMVELLIPLQKGMKDKDGNTAFVHALRNKHEGIASLLIEHESRSLPEKCLMESNLAEARSPSASNKPITILLLGEPGVGKSTFVNGFINYLRFDHLPETAEEVSQIQWAVPMKFVLLDENYAETTVRMGPSDDNENMENVSVSVTQDPKLHVFNANGTEVHLIDTPGIGDTRGYDYDKANCAKIIDFIRDYEIHGIFILVKPNSARLTLTFKFCVEELLVHLPVGAKENIVFCFTNARSTHYRPGDSYVALKELLDQRKVDIKLSKDTMYCFDNEAMRFLAARASGVTSSTESVDDFRESWARAAKELRRAIQSLHLAIPLYGGEIKRLEDVRKTVIGLSKPIAEITQIITRNIAISREHQRELESLDGSERDLEMRLKVKILEYHSEEFDQPCTVCMQCAKYVQIEGINCVEYDMACHEGCYLDNVVPMALGDPNLTSCSSMSSGTCKLCGHSYEQHLHTYHKACPREIVIDDPGVAQRLRDTKDRKGAIEQAVRQNTEMGEQYEAEQRRIIEISARFALFVEKNAILGFNASLGTYLKAQIESLQNKIPSDPSEPHEHILRSLENFRRSLNSYNEERRIFQEAVSNGDAAVPTAGEVEAMIRELEGLPLTGKDFQQALRDICHHANCAGGPRDV